MTWHQQGRQRIPGMKGRSSWLLPVFALAFLALVSATPPDAKARDAAFLDPGAAAGAGASDEAIKVEPGGIVDIGDSVLNVARRSDLFFVNQTANPVKVEKIAVNGDGNVATEIVSDDCSKQGTISPGSRCSVEVSLTPSSPGPWTAEVLMTHDGVGRIARAKLTGKTSGTASTEKKDMGLALNTKEASPVNFGDVDVGNGKIVRSALMVNDSNEPITLYSIDVIEASNGLQKLDQGCAVDMELKPGESCPVTLLWAPSSPGQISTDLIIRHSGRLGFAVIPIRGVAKGDGKEKPSQGSSEQVDAGASARHSLPLPPGAPEVEKEMSGKVPAVSTGALGAPSGETKSTGHFYLIGTVGNRAIILKPDGKTVVANSGDDFDVGEAQAHVIMVSAKSVDLTVDGKKKTLYLGSSPELVEKASLKAKSATKDKDADFSSGSSSSSSSSGSASPGSSTGGGTVAGGSSGSGAAR